MKVSKNFILQEFVPKEIYEQFGDGALRFAVKQQVDLVQFIRDYFNVPVTVNNWHTGGQYNYSGYRQPDCKTGAKLSAHKLSLASDLKFKGMSPKDVYDAILANEKLFMSHGLTTLENIKATPTWAHVSTMWTGLDNILIVNP